MSLKFIEGIQPSPSDYRDYISTAYIPTDISLPPQGVAWDEKYPAVFDQKQYGTCAGQMGAGLKCIHEAHEGYVPQGGMSALFAYTMAKKYDGIPNAEGTYIRTVYRILQEFGICSEKSLPYSLLTDVKKLPQINQQMLSEAQNFRVNTYMMIPNRNINNIKQALLYSPVGIGVFVTDGFMFPEKGGFINKMNGSMYGWHAVLIVNYFDNMTHTYLDGKTYKGFFKVRNSWSSAWGDKGYCYIPYDIFYQVLDDGMPFCCEAWMSEDARSIKPEPQKLHRVQVGAFKIKENATKLSVQLKERGFPIYIPPQGKDGFWRVQVGAYAIRKNAENMKIKLVKNGFKDAFIV